MMKKEVKIWLSIGCVVAVAVLGSIFVNLGMEWFDGLSKPSEWPPNVLIPIVWTVIYLVAIAYLWIALNRNGINKELAVLLGVNGGVKCCMVFNLLYLPRIAWWIGVYFTKFDCGNCASNRT